MMVQPEDARLRGACGTPSLYRRMDIREMAEEKNQSVSSLGSFGIFWRVGAPRDTIHDHSHAGEISL
jgi:hypothetical protein